MLNTFVKKSIPREVHNIEWMIFYSLHFKHILSTWYCSFVHPVFGLRSLSSKEDPPVNEKTKDVQQAEIKEELPILHKPLKDGDKKADTVAGAKKNKEAVVKSEGSQTKAEPEGKKMKCRIRTWRQHFEVFLLLPCKCWPQASNLVFKRARPLYRGTRPLHIWMLQIVRAPRPERQWPWWPWWNFRPDEGLNKSENYLGKNRELFWRKPRFAKFIRKPRKKCE